MCVDSRLFEFELFLSNNSVYTANMADDTDETSKMTVHRKKDTFDKFTAMIVTSIPATEVDHERHNNSRFDEKVQFPHCR